MFRERRCYRRRFDGFLCRLCVETRRGTHSRRREFITIVSARECFASLARRRLYQSKGSVTVVEQTGAGAEQCLADKAEQQSLGRIELPQAGRAELQSR